MPAIANYRGIIPAISCPFTPDHRIDEPALRKLASWLAGHLLSPQASAITGQDIAICGGLSLPR